jgi:hypothetical protein
MKRGLVCLMASILVGYILLSQGESFLENCWETIGVESSPGFVGVKSSERFHEVSSTLAPIRLV